MNEIRRWVNNSIERMQKTQDGQENKISNKNKGRGRKKKN